jgi:hypothetical protein
MTGNVALVGAEASVETGQLKTQAISIMQFQRAEEVKVVKIIGQL